MNEVRLKARSSSGEPHEVVFTHHGTFFTVFCPCEAGIYGKMCKHKLQLMVGDETMLSEPGEASKLKEIRSWVEASEFAPMLESYAALKRETDEAKRRERDFRKTMEQAMRKGIAVPEIE